MGRRVEAVHINFVVVFVLYLDPPFNLVENGHPNSTNVGNGKGKEISSSLAVPICHQVTLPWLV